MGPTRPSTGSLTADLRCLDAHAHLGLWLFDGSSEATLRDALKRYEVGVRIGELSLPSEFNGVLLWSQLTTVLSCAASRATGSPCGGWASLKPPGRCLSACSG